MSINLNRMHNYEKKNTNFFTITNPVIALNEPVERTTMYINNNLLDELSDRHCHQIIIGDRIKKR